MEQIPNSTKQGNVGRGITILLAETNTFLGQKIEEILSRDEAVRWVAHVTKRSQLLREAPILYPDLILGDIALLKEKGTVEALRQRSPRARIVALTDSADEPYAIMTRRLGLDGMVEKGRIEIAVLKKIIQSRNPGNALS